MTRRTLAIKQDFTLSDHTRQFDMDIKIWQVIELSPSNIGFDFDMDKFPVNSTDRTHSLVYFFSGSCLSHGTPIIILLHVYACML